MSDRIETLAAHARRIVMTNEPLALPIYQTSTYSFESIEMLEKYLEGDDTQYLYTRYENPTLRALQDKIAELEKGEHCSVFSSGMAAITSAVLAFVKSGDEILASDSLYGRTQYFFEKWLPGYGVRTKFVPLAEFPDIDRHFSPQTRLVYIESPTNPTIRVVDIRATAGAAHRHNALLFIDNTFASPVNQNPIPLGADIVLHSLTKYMAGHSDVIGGAAIYPKAHAALLRETIRTFGGTMDPLAAFLVERGLKTMVLRVEKQSRTAMILAERLEKHPAVRRVNYPGLKSHPQHEVAAAQMRHFGGMMSFDLDGYEAARHAVEKFRLIRHAASLGGVESIVSLPVLTSHRGQSDANLEAAGITSGTIRFSVGVEDPEDLWADLAGAL